MSIRLIAAVLDHAPCDGAMLVLLIALADQATDEGYCYPGVARLARRCRRSERRTQEMLAELVQRRWLKIENRQGGRGKSADYWIQVETILADAEAMRAEKGCDDGRTVSNEKGCEVDRTVSDAETVRPTAPFDQQTVRPGAEKGAEAVARKGAEATAPESSGTVTEPPRAPAHPPGGAGAAPLSEATTTERQRSVLAWLEERGATLRDRAGRWLGAEWLVEVQGYPADVLTAVFRENRPRMPSELRRALVPWKGKRRTPDDQAAADRRRAAAERQRQADEERQRAAAANAAAEEHARTVALEQGRELLAELDAGDGAPAEGTPEAMWVGALRNGVSLGRVTPLILCSVRDRVMGPLRARRQAVAHDAPAGG